MIAVDTNVLVYAHRDESDHHALAVAWLRHLAEGAAPWALPVFTFGEFLRVVTHPKLFDRPTAPPTALEFLSALLESPTVRVIAPGRLFPRLLAESVLDAEARGNLVFDAQMVAACREHGVARLLTRDRDFHRFSTIEPLLMTAPPPA